MEEFSEYKIDTAKKTGCIHCGAYAKCKTPRIEPVGDNNKGIVILLPQPTKLDESAHLKGDYFKKLAKVFSEGFGLDLLKDCKVIHAVQCHTTKLAGKTEENCRERVFKQIKDIKPKIVYAVGELPMRILFNDIWKGEIGSVENFTDYVIPHRELHTKVIPIYSPTFVASCNNGENKWDKQVDVIWERQIEKGVEAYDKPYLHYDYDSKVRVITDANEAITQLDKWLDNPPKYLAFDYEATGLKPYNKGHKITHISLCDGEYSYSMPLFDDSEYRYYLMKILGDNRIGKIAHNMSFEQTWTRALLGYEVYPLVWDSCLASHLLDIRSGTAGLKFQTFVRFGIGDYSSHIEEYLKGQAVKSKYNDGDNWESYTHCNCINKVTELKDTDVLHYCGLDSLFTYKLAMIQMEEMPNKVPNCGMRKGYGYDLLHNATLAYNKMSYNGFRIDRNILSETMDKTILEKQRTYEALLQQPLFIEMKEWAGDKFNIDSSDQLGKFLHDHKKIPCKKFTEKGGYACDEEALGKLKMQELTDLIEYKKLDKTLNTYLKPIWFETNDDDIIRANFSLFKTKSMRSSSDSPNFQNIPKNNKLMKNLIRSCIFPHKGQFLAELDYKSLEVFIGCAYHKDKRMLDYLLDDNADMHRDLATVLFLTTKKVVGDEEIWEKYGTKEIRRETKGVLTFPIQYGSYYVSMAKDGWEVADNLVTKEGVNLKDHIKYNMGLTMYKAWEDHVKEIEDFYWNDLFGTYGQWKKDNYKFYQKYGYFDSKTGIRYAPYLKRNQVGNFAIQGSASHCVAYAVTKMMEWLEEKDKKSKIVGQIHDSIVMSIEPDEAWEVLSMMKYFMEDGVIKHFTWIDVPLFAEADIGEVDCAWNTLKEMKWEEIKIKFNENKH